MKKFIITIILALLSVAVCVLCATYVDKVACKAKDYVEQIELSVTNQQYRSALGQTNELSNFWEDNHDKLSMILHHEMLEDIEESIALMKASLEHPEEDNSNFWQQATSSLTKIKNLQDTEFPSLANIL